MKKNGSVALRIAGFLEVLIGVGSILMTVWILKEGKTDEVVLGLNVAKKALLTLVAIYFIAGFRVLSGLIAIAFANKPKRHKLCMALGCTLMILSIVTMNKGDYSLDTVVINYLLLAIPATYIYGALKNKKYLETASTK